MSENQMINKLERLKNLDSGKLEDVVKNYRQYGYDKELRNEAMRLLEERGISKDLLELKGGLENRTYTYAMEQYRAFIKNSNITLVFYVFLLFSSIFIPIIFLYAPAIGEAALIFKRIMYLPFLFFFVRSFLNQNRFYDAIGERFGAAGVLLYLFFGMPIYVVMYFVFRKQMKDRMKEIR